MKFNVKLKRKCEYVVAHRFYVCGNIEIAHSNTKFEGFIISGHRKQRVITR
jgi:hypothetical protein